MNDSVLQEKFKPIRSAAIEASLTPAIVFDALADRVGAENGITARKFVIHLLGFWDEGAERQLRHIIEALRNEGHPVCAHPGTGYYLARTADEVDKTCLFLYSRAMASLKQIAKLKRIAVPDFRGQLNLPVNEGESA